MTAVSEEITLTPAEIWCLEAIKHSLSLKSHSLDDILADIDSPPPTFIEGQERLNTAALNTLANISKDTLNALTTQEFTTNLLLHRDYLIEASMQIVANLSREDAEHLWWFVLSSQYTNLVPLQFPSSATFTSLTNYPEAFNLYEKLLNYRDGRF